MTRLEKPARRHLTLFALVALFASMEAGPVFAACNGVRVRAAWNNRISKASSPTIRTAYANGTCTITKGPHGGGFTPTCAGSSHVTVRVGGTSCHVFIRSTACTGSYFPTTCF